MKRIFFMGMIMTMILGVHQAMAHEHKSPHQGTLVVLGEEFSHLEFVLDAEEGRLTAYALDGEAENAVRLSQREINLEVFKHKGQPDQQQFDLTLKAVDNVLTGEAVGDTSEFTVQSDDLKSLDRFSAVIADVTIRGAVFKDVDFDFPEGNEHDEE